jgi:hypothetical protein
MDVQYIWKETMNTRNVLVYISQISKYTDLLLEWLTLSALKCIQFPHQYIKFWGFFVIMYISMGHILQVTSFYISKTNSSIITRESFKTPVVPHNPLIVTWGRCGYYCMVVGFITTYAISAYHHLCCEFKFSSWWGVLDTILCDKWLAEGR